MSRVLVGFEALPSDLFTEISGYVSEIYITRIIIIIILSLLLLSSEFIGPAVSVQLVHVESAQPRTRAVKVEPVHSVELVLISSLQ